MDTQIIDKINELWNLKKNGKFQNYIEYMVFPYYKNLMPNTKIIFHFPITILVGKNGSGKSSTLQALYGAPKGKSPSFFWFSTNLDPIEESGDRNRFFYGYKETFHSEIKEVRKSRIKRSKSSTKKENLDYWETTRPAISDGMIPLKGKIRNDPVDKDVVYIDFRGELSAFDKYFYFGEPKDEKPQDFLRRKSKYLDNLFSNGNPLYPGGHHVYDNIIELDKKCINKINEILCKKYTSVKMVNHRIFEKWGTSVLVSTNDIKYSEANAGSGEIAIIKLVYKIMSAKPFSLILLDEPEVSLHPSAQKKLKLFLIEESINRKHQIIISSHSPIFIESMPQEALKVFETSNDNKFKIKENVNSIEAFYTIEENIKNKINLFCEDKLSQLILERVAQKIGIEQYFNIKYIHGGAETMLSKYIPIHCTSNADYHSYFVLDGDKNYHPKIDISKLTSKQLTSYEFLSESIKRLTNINISFNVDGNNGTSRKDQKIAYMKEYIEYHFNNVFYFPNNKTPEQIILKSKFTKSGSLFLPLINENLNSYEAKKHILKITESIFLSKDNRHYEHCTELLVARWLEDENDDFSYIENILRNILDKNPI